MPRISGQGWVASDLCHVAQVLSNPFRFWRGPQRVVPGPLLGGTLLLMPTVLLHSSLGGEMLCETLSPGLGGSKGSVRLKSLAKWECTVSSQVCHMRGVEGSRERVWTQQEGLPLGPHHPHEAWRPSWQK